MVRSTLLFGIGSPQAIPVGSGPGYFDFGVGGTYSDMNAACTAVMADRSTTNSSGYLLTNLHLQVRRGGLTTTTKQSLPSGLNLNGFTVYIEPFAGEGFIDLWTGGQALFPNTSYGAFIRFGYVSDWALFLCPAGVGAIMVRDLIIVQTNNGNPSGGSPCMGGILSSGSSYNYSRLMCLTEGVTDHSPMIECGGPGVTINETNCLLVGSNNTYSNLDFLAVETQYQGAPVVYNARYNTHVQQYYNVNQGYGWDVNSTGTDTFQNNVAMQFGQGVGGENNGADYHNNGSSLLLAQANATSLSTFSYPMFGANGGVTGATLTHEFVGALTDYRLSAGSILRGAGVHGAGGVTTDILGLARNSTDDIGCIAFGSGG